MRITRWVSFTWDLGNVDLPELSVPRQYRLTVAGGEDDAELQGMITKSLALDPGWNSSLHDVTGLVTSSIARAFGSPSTLRLPLRHGTRIIGGTLLAAQSDAPEHLIPGPCTLVEYRNRGLGTLLLGTALRHLREAGIMRACAITREGSPAARFLYPKFGGIPSPVAPLLAA